MIDTVRRSQLIVACRDFRDHEIRRHASVRQMPSLAFDWSFLRWSSRCLPGSSSLLPSIHLPATLIVARDSESSG